MSASVQDELSRMRVILQDLERRLEDGEVPPDGLPEFKSTVDEIRHSADPVVRQFIEGRPTLDEADLVKAS